MNYPSNSFILERLNYNTQYYKYCLQLHLTYFTLENYFSQVK